VIEHARSSIVQIDARIERVALELDSLNALRAGWERYLALLGAPIDSADHGVRSGASPAEPEPGDVPPVASAPANQQPGSARGGQRERRERGRRAPATMAAPIATTSVPVGTPTPASRSSAGRAVDPAKGWVRCPECGERVRAQGLERTARGRRRMPRR
jgi:hypothetical protein